MNAKNKKANRIGGEGVISDTHKFNSADCIRKWRAQSKLGESWSPFSLLLSTSYRVLNGGEQERDIAFCGKTIVSHFNIILFNRSAESQSRWGGCDVEERKECQPPTQSGWPLFLVLFAKNEE